MSTSAEIRPNGSVDLLQPKPRKPVNPTILRTRNESEERVSSNGTPTSGISSRAETPVPEDAPPSAHATSSVRQQIRAFHKRRIFPTIEYEARVSHFDPKSEYTNFRGFFVLFWIGLAIMVVTAMLRNVKETGYPLTIRQWDLFTKNLWEMGLSDFLMVASTAVSLPLHKMYMSSKGIFRWKRGGMVIQSIYQAAWLSFWVSWPFLRNWTWTAQVFFTLHLLSMFMKMHSYAFYNGHLSEARRRLKDLDTPETASRAKLVRYPSTRTLPHSPMRDQAEMTPQNETSKNDVDVLREDLAYELTSPLGRVTYPQNLTVCNYVDYLFCPTLCYEIEYPRTDGINWMELFYKSLAVFGCVFLMIVTSEEFVIPVLDESAPRLQQSRTLLEGSLVLAETISKLLFPFMVIFLLVFLVIFEYVLGAFAEITCFADRQFYADWWNSTDWLEFSREWNIPVHHFFRRHVYSASRANLSRPVATVITFLISALAHELVMICITKKFRGYGFVAMMLQMPIVMVQRSKWVRGRTLLNNILFWVSMILGLSMMCALYVLV
ncbi:MAG: hypothetical protein M1821_007527 [Bathelium mastoideum]|nr:MAG: hypothetical protein M1821_007527 [Bathelium mastoideum]KAI9695031.1 MAG: hypothetical protein M1822_000648 [Bathelium mastoideum]